MMQLMQVTLLFVLLCVFCSLTYSEHGSSLKKVNSETKWKQLYDLSRRERNNVITLDDSSYEYYAIDKPRPYTIIVFLTAAHPKFKCTICEPMDKDFQVIAETYHEEHEKQARQGVFPNIFFVRIDYESSSRTFQNYELNTVPYIFHIPAYQGERASKDYDVNHRDKFQISSEPKIETILQFIRDRYQIIILSLTILCYLCNTYIYF